MPVNFVPSANDYLRLLPELIMIVAGTLIMLLVSVLPENKKNSLASLTLLAFVAALAAAVLANGNQGLWF
jgi:NADH:ubiquinone oxidoreductase subunit 2 (subunit N)